MLTLTKQEKETIFLTTEADHTVTISTYNAVVRQILLEFSAQFPEVCSQQYQTPEGRVTYVLDKAWISTCFLPLLMQDCAIRSLSPNVRNLLQQQNNYH